PASAPVLELRRNPPAPPPQLTSQASSPPATLPAIGTAGGTGYVGTDHDGGGPAQADRATRRAHRRHGERSPGLAALPRRTAYPGRAEGLPRSDTGRTGRGVRGTDRAREGAGAARRRREEAGRAARKGVPAARKAGD